MSRCKCATSDTLNHKRVTNAKCYNNGRPTYVTRDGVHAFEGRIYAYYQYQLKRNAGMRLRGGPHPGEVQTHDAKQKGNYRKPSCAHRPLHNLHTLHSHNMGITGRATYDEDFAFNANLLPSCGYACREHVKTTQIVSIRPNITFLSQKDPNHLCTMSW